MRTTSFFGVLILAAVISQASFAAETEKKPLMKDFIGLNGHFQFKPDLYKQTGRLVRNYHNVDWDVKKPGDPITLPMCVNKVNWQDHVYGKWAKQGYEIDVCAQFGRFSESNKGYLDLWRGQEEWLYKYGYELATYFGPSGQQKLVTSIEVDNEPGADFDDALYQRLFIQMAKGIRAGDPKIKILTATAQSGKADDYSKSLEETFSSPEIVALYDVINVHVYALKPKVKGQSPWDRSYPEDPAIDYLKKVDGAIAFRDQKAPGKEVWITEFGYDSCTPEAMKKREGWFEKLNWTGVTDLQQAQYLVRSFFCFAERDVNRAYLYFFNDDDKASVHAASGLTRNFKPKPSFWAVKQLYDTLGDYRFKRVVQQEAGKIYSYEFVSDNAAAPIIWAVWSPTGSGREQAVTLANLPGKFIAAEAMATAEGEAGPVECQRIGDGVKLTLSESPTYLKFARGK